MEESRQVAVEERVVGEVGTAGRGVVLLGVDVIGEVVYFVLVDGPLPITVSSFAKDLSFFSPEKMEMLKKGKDRAEPEK